MHTYINTCIETSGHNINTNIQQHRHTHIHTYIQTHIKIIHTWRIHACIHVYIHMGSPPNIHTYIDT